MAVLISSSALASGSTPEMRKNAVCMVTLMRPRSPTSSAIFVPSIT